MPNRNEPKGMQDQRRPFPQANNRGDNDTKDGANRNQNPNMSSSPAGNNKQGQGGNQMAQRSPHPGPGQQQGGQGGDGQRQQRDQRGDKRNRPPFQGGRRDQKQNQNDTLNPMPELDAGPRPEKKFTGRCRLFVGNLASDVTESDFKQMFEKYGEVSETFLNSQKGFGFIRLDTRLNAETAKAALDGTAQKNRTIRVRFATHGAALRVKNIPPSTSNELLEQAFSMFGEVERAIVIVDDRGRPTRNGIIEFARKPGAQNALNRIRNGVFLLTASPFPIAVEPLEQKDEEDGNPERYIQKNREYQRERETQPRFAGPGSFEYEWGLRMKALEEEEKLKREQMEKNIEDSRLKVMDEMEIAKTEHQTIVMRQELMRRQEELQRLEDQRREFEIRRNERDERRRQEEGLFRQQQEDEVRRRMVQQDDMRLQQQDMLRRQEELQMQRDQGSMRPMQGGVGGPQPLMGGGGGGAGARGAGAPQGGSANPDLIAQQGAAGRQSRFDQGPGFNNGQNRGNQGGISGVGAGNGNQSAPRGGPGAPGVLGSSPANPQANNQGGRGGGPQQGNRGGSNNQQGGGGRGPNNQQGGGGRGGPNQQQGGPNNGGGPGGYGSRGPSRPPMDDGRGRMPVERRDLERGVGDRPRMERRDDFMNKRMRRF